MKPRTVKLSRHERLVLDHDGERWRVAYYRPAAPSEALPAGVKRDPRTGYAELRFAARAETLLAALELVFSDAADAWGRPPHLAETVDLYVHALPWAESFPK